MNDLLIRKATNAICLAVPFALIGSALILIFVLAPTESSMGDVQRILYFHVGSAVASYCAILTLFICSIAYLVSRQIKYDLVAEAAGEIALLFCSITLLMGMIWAKSAWNTFFSWEPRLVSFVVLWLILLAFNLLRVFGEQARIAQHSAVLGILSAVTVPLVILSIRLLPQTEQLHPRMPMGMDSMDILFAFTLRFSILAVVALQFFLVWLRARYGFMKQYFLVEK